MKVTLLRDFVEDGRTSMEVHADHLAEHLGRLKDKHLDLHQYRPQLGKGVSRLPTTGNLRMRTARYFDYLQQAKKLDSDVFHILDHGYAHLLKVLDPSKTVVTVHDTIPLLAGRGLIDGIKARRRSWLNEYSLGFVKSARKVIAISESTKTDLVQHCGCSPERIEVIYFGMSANFRPLADKDKSLLRKELVLPEDDKKLVLITGQEYYKNHETCLKVVEALVAKHTDKINLVRLGRRNPEWDHLKANSSIEHQIIEITSLKHDLMPKLYNAVDCVLFPSWYEGFGWPPVEAMACGTPSVVSNRASLPEVVGEAGLKFDPHDVQGLADGLEQVLFDEHFRQNQVERGLAHVKRYAWAPSAQRVFEIYRTISSRESL